MLDATRAAHKLAGRYWTVHSAVQLEQWLKRTCWKRTTCLTAIVATPLTTAVPTPNAATAPTPKATGRNMLDWR